LMEFGGEYKLLKELSYTIPHSSHHRRLVIFERQGAA
jgi:hypothetical protein